MLMNERERGRESGWLAVCPGNPNVGWLQTDDDALSSKQVSRLVHTLQHTLENGVRKVTARQVGFRRRRHRT